MESRRKKNEENKPLMYLPFILLLKNIHLLKADSKYSLTETIYYENIKMNRETDNDILVKLICF